MAQHCPYDRTALRRVPTQDKNLYVAFYCRYCRQTFFMAKRIWRDMKKVRRF